MMLLISAISVVLFTYFSIKASDKRHIALPTIFGLLFIGSIVAMIANGSYHYGMAKETVVKEQKLVSSADMNGMNILMYQGLGDGSEKIYLTKTSDDQKEPKATGTNNVINKVIEDSKEAKWVQSTTYWVPKNNTMKALFNYGSNKKEFVSEKNEFYLTKDWQVLSTDQLEKFGKLIKEKQATMAEDIKSFIEEGIKQAMMKDPSMGKEAIEKLTEQLTAQFQQKVVAEVLAAIK
ncbi:DUF4811 domain-containing protein [Vagococcus xieshaowenii]|uniref:DUF4811 domain-containing protein n=1 Tax=Vagococcus xieshaowenii TaxID=2562451 RepID=A0AAJ5EFU0_9ENTE|nr:DUF4811 domain-containing protein [Vagococcus xieshaowenii]QCA29066.1 DUF4811 domain-containing protein [Vagococcus xieshaowenii]TFZ40958.1 DUF4811 domain-containing protein [Vagococcus xieshaowenii]